VRFWHYCNHYDGQKPGQRSLLIDAVQIQSVLAAGTWKRTLHQRATDPVGPTSTPHGNSVYAYVLAPGDPSSYFLSPWPQTRDAAPTGSHTPVPGPSFEQPCSNTQQDDRCFRYRPRIHRTWTHILCEPPETDLRA
jgi:hypothetical protein